MKSIIFNLIFVLLISFSTSFPHFIFDGIKSKNECTEEEQNISFIIYGSLTEKPNLRKIKVEDYLINDMGEFKCFFSENENSNNPRRKHKITCSIQGKFLRKGYILEEPRVFGFDFMNEEGESTWPNISEKKTFLIGECGSEIELDDEPILFADSSEYSNPLDTVRKGIVDNALGTLPKREEVDEIEMCSLMKNAQKDFELSESESAYFVYKWIGENIAYDCFAYVHGGINPSETFAYNNGKGICNSFSLMYITMCNALGLEAVQIIGYSKGASYVEGQIPTQASHAWNAVKINSKYYLVDPTWGAGGCSGDAFYKEFNDIYFCTKPELFIRKHLPVDSKWQFLDRVVTMEEFVQMAKLSNGFFDCGFNSINPDTNSINVQGQSKIILTYDPSIDVTLTLNLYYIQNNNQEEVNNKLFYTKGNGKAEINFITSKKGEYKLRIYGRLVGTDREPHLVDYKIINTKEMDDSLGYPNIYSYYSNSDMQIIQPLNSPLKKGSSVKFQIKTKTYSDLYLVYDGKFDKMTKTNGVFEKTITVSGSQVRVSVLKDDSYWTAIDYTTN